MRGTREFATAIRLENEATNASKGVNASGTLDKLCASHQGEQRDNFPNPSTALTNTMTEGHVGAFPNRNRNRAGKGRAVLPARHPASGGGAPFP